MSELTLIIILAGAGTFLLRFLPIWQARRRPAATRTSGRVQAFLQGIGPAAMTALLVVSLWPLMVHNEHIGQTLATIAALTIIYAVKRWFSGIALPTLAGALCYGIFMHLLGG
ncbi:MAG TPA: AzlD domain-containing protein [Burkholderiaceae bacterium]|mgnify:CR=1 FL=1|nr:AzlD domain-containing protein [Burkholderiaceae bacterium]